MKDNGELRQLVRKLKDQSKVLRRVGKMWRSKYEVSKRRPTGKKYGKDFIGQQRFR
jgi:hypothetical protein